MPKRFRTSASSRTQHWSTGRRVTVLAAGLALLTLVAGLLAYATGRADQADPGAGHTAPRPPDHSAASPSPGNGAEEGGPPSTTHPTVFAKAAAQRLWSYDTRHTSRDQHLERLKRWMTDEKRYADFSSVTAQIPEPVLWSRMHDQGQHASAKTTSARFPGAFKTAMARDPGAVTEAYIYAVTVSGKQSISWRGGGAGAEGRQTTLAVQCRPDAPCHLSGVAPQTAP